jgi:hypothetical protein
MARIQDGAYVLRSWVYLLHPFLVFTAALGVALAVGRQAPVFAIAGMAGFTLWAFNEAGQQTLTLFAFDRWRVAWTGADETLREAIRVNALMYDGIRDAMGQIGVTLLPQPVLDWAYPAIQPLGRLAIGVWLWRVAGAGLSRV